MMYNIKLCKITITMAHKKNSVIVYSSRSDDVTQSIHLSVRSSVVPFFRNISNHSNMNHKLYRGILNDTMFSDNEITLDPTMLLLSPSIQTVTICRVCTCSDCNHMLSIILFCLLHSIAHRSFRVHSTLFI